MLIYDHENGYGNVKINQCTEIISALTIDASSKARLVELLYDYQCLLRVIQGEAVFKHPDGSEIRRLKLIEV